MYTKAMNKKQIHKTIQYIICVVFLLTSVMLTGCGKETVDDGMTYFHHSIADQTEADTQETQKEEAYLITGIDQTEESLRLYRYTNGMEYRFYYGADTQFLAELITQHWLTGNRRNLHPLHHAHQFRTLF